MTIARIETDARSTSSFPGIVANTFKPEVGNIDKLLLNAANRRFEKLEEYLRRKFASTAVVNLNAGTYASIINSSASETLASEEDDESLSYEQLASMPHKVVPVRLVLTYRGKGKAIIQNDDIL